MACTAGITNSLWFKNDRLSGVNLTFITGDVLRVTNHDIMPTKAKDNENKMKPAFSLEYKTHKHFYLPARGIRRKENRFMSYKNSGVVTSSVSQHQLKKQYSHYLALFSSVFIALSYDWVRLYNTDTKYVLQVKAVNCTGIYIFFMGMQSIRYQATPNFA